MAQLEGTRLGDYELIERIGGGGMAEVYRARQLRAFNREVALKVIRPGFSEQEEFRARFLREAQVISRLSHPHILPLIDFGEQDTILYLVMQLVREGNLRDLLRAQQGPLPLAQAISLFTQLCSAVQYAHSQGIIHRDIKPQNVLLQQGTHVLLADFGIARASNEQGMTATGAGIGTAEYMAPEQALGRADARSDIYSLGIVLYQMLTGAVPFAGATPIQVMMRHTNEPLPDPRTFNPNLPPLLVQALQTALEKAPDARFQSAQSLGRAVQEAQASVQPQQEIRPSGWLPNIPPQPEQRPSGWQVPAPSPTAQRPFGWLSGSGARPSTPEGWPSAPRPGQVDSYPSGAYGTPPAVSQYGNPMAGPGRLGPPPAESFGQYPSAGASSIPGVQPSQSGFDAPPDLYSAPTRQGQWAPMVAPGYSPPGTPGQPGAPVPPQRRNGPLIAILSIIALVVLLGGGALVFFSAKGSPGQSNSPTQVPTATALPTATATPSAPPGYKVFTNTTMTFSIDYPVDWSEVKAPSGTGDGTEFLGTANQIFIVTDIGASSADPTILDDAFCEGANGNGGFGGKPTAPKQVMIDGQSWTQEECTNTSNGEHAAVETVIYKGHVYLIAYASLIASFASNRSQYFTPMEQTFKFLT